MIDVRVYIPKREWVIDLHIAVEDYNLRLIFDELSRLGISDDSRSRAEALMRSGKTNVAFTFSNGERRESIIVLSKATSAAEFLNSFEHEISHIVDDIVMTDEIYNKEERGYLVGELNQILYPYVAPFLCEGCRKRRFFA